jgi:hypothetical protein
MAVDKKEDLDQVHYQHMYIFINIVMCGNW